MEIDSCTEPVAGVELDVSCESDAVRIRNVTFSNEFPLVLFQPPDELPAQHYSTARARTVTRASSPSEGTGLFATIELEVVKDGPFTASVQINARASVVGKHKVPTIVYCETRADSIENGVRLRIENRPEQSEEAELAQAVLADEATVIATNRRAKGQP